MTKARRNNLIFDVGVNEGLDSAFYLDKGFAVVGVEASPLLAETLREQFSDQIKTGFYTFVGKGVWPERTELTFYLNTYESHWSSFIKEAGTRNGKYEEFPVECIPLIDLFKQYGVPYYLKIDIEAADKVVVKSLKEADVLPEFISVEEYGLEAFEDLSALGYNSFAVVPQSDKSRQIPPKRPLEGRYVDRAFTYRDSGLFGLELSVPWMSLNDAKTYFAKNIRQKDMTYVGPKDEWHDIHASSMSLGGLRMRTILRRAQATLVSPFSRTRT